MKTAIVLIFSLAAIAVAQDGKSDEVKRLSSVTWDLNTHKLAWVVQKGTEVNGEFTPSSSERYEVSPDEAVMIAQNEKRGFGGDEAASLHHLLDVLSLYCAESVVWWEEGQGSPVDRDGVKPSTPKKTENSTQPPAKDSRPTRVDQSKPKKQPVVIAPGTLVARNGAQ